MAPARMKIVGREERRKKRTPCGGVQLETRPVEGAGRGLTVGAPDGMGACGARSWTGTCIGNPKTRVNNGDRLVKSFTGPSWPWKIRTSKLYAAQLHV